MFVYRVACLCPKCSNEEEGWISLGKMVPHESITCTNCSYTFDGQSYIYKFLPLRTSS